MPTRPTMTRAGYEMIATQVRECREAFAKSTICTPRERLGAKYAFEALAHRFADQLAATNDRFDRERFIAACDPAGGYHNKSRPTAQAKRIARNTRARAHEAVMNRNGLGLVSEDISDDDDECCNPAFVDSE